VSVTEDEFGNTNVIEDCSLGGASLLSRSGWIHSKRTSLVLELATRGFLVTSKMGVRSTTSPSSNVQVTRTRNIHHVTDTYSTMRVTRSSVHKPNLVADGSNQGYSSEEDILPGGPLLEINEMPQPTASDVAARWINIYHVGVCR
jgi:hypothetical protein